jgi:putative nucleotidyltransferase with HDIG domain
MDNSELEHNLGMRTSYEVLCDTENDLMKRLKQCSEALYEHALYIGDLSCRAALTVGANELLAKAGGYYHEIGKINGKNYIEEGLIIADDYAFPKELKAILKEHNIKYEKPGSIEAAIVMLSDSVVSTIEYIEKMGDHKYTTVKVIDNIFQMRMEKGTFDASELSLKAFKTLKEFYQKEFNNKEFNHKEIQ